MGTSNSLANIEQVVDVGLKAVVVVVVLKAVVDADVGFKAVVDVDVGLKT